MITIQTMIKKDKDDDNDEDKDKDKDKDNKDTDWNGEIKRGITCHGRKENKWKRVNGRILKILSN